MVRNTWLSPGGKPLFWPPAGSRPWRTWTTAKVVRRLTSGSALIRDQSKPGWFGSTVMVAGSGAGPQPVERGLPAPRPGGGRQDRRGGQRHQQRQRGEGPPAPLVLQAGPGRDDPHGCPSARPSRIRMIRPAAAATSGACVTMMIVWPLACSCRRSASTSCAPSLSRAPVGSSASSRSGSLTSARAIASRWRWPPESALGGLPAVLADASRSSRSRPREMAAVAACRRGCPAASGCPAR